MKSLFITIITNKTDTVRKEHKNRNQRPNKNFNIKWIFIYAVQLVTKTNIH